MGSDAPGKSADIAIRKREGGLYFVPESREAEEWLVARQASHGDARRPPAKLDKEGRITADGYTGAIRGFTVERAQVEAVMDAAERAGLLVRRMHRS